MANSLMRIEAVKQAIQTLPITPRVLANLRETARLFSTNDGRRSPEHAHVKFKRHGIAKYDHGIVGVNGIQQNVPFSANRRRRDEQCRALSAANPIVTECAQGFVSGFVPTCWQHLHVNSGNLKRVRDLAFGRNQICWSQVRFKVNKGLDRSEGQ